MNQSPLHDCYLVGDCLELMDYLDDGSIDLIISDLPYGKTRNSWDVPINTEQLWARYSRVLRLHGAVLLFAAQPFATDLIQSNRAWFRYDLIWTKNRKSGFLNARRMPLRAHELILVFYRKAPTYNPIKSHGHEPVNAFYTRYAGANYGPMDKPKGGGSTERYPTSLLAFSAVNNDAPQRIHPTQKPVDLLAYLIELYSKQGDLVLDNCAGSGSTAVACIQTGRHYLCFDKDSEIAGPAREWISIVDAQHTATSSGTVET